jgi:hypothetical protein
VRFECELDATEEGKWFGIWLPHGLGGGLDEIFAKQYQELKLLEDDCEKAKWFLGDRRISDEDDAYTPLTHSPSSSQWYSSNKRRGGYAVITPQL